MDNKSGQIRIIGGQYRSRVIRFNETDSLRPTPSQIRETLFNWLQETINGARCLDLFAGSGALGFEAISRGAKSVTFVELLRSVIQSLEKNIALLNIEEDTHIKKLNIPNEEFRQEKPFDIVFIDPPYQKGLIQPTLDWLIENTLITTNSLLYIETERQKKNDWVKNYHVIHLKHKKNIDYGLFQIKEPT